MGVGRGKLIGVGVGALVKGGTGYRGAVGGAVVGVCVGRIVRGNVLTSDVVTGANVETGCGADVGEGHHHHGDGDGVGKSCRGATSRAPILANSSRCVSAYSFTAASCSFVSW